MTTEMIIEHECPICFTVKGFPKLDHCTDCLHIVCVKCLLQIADIEINRGNWFSIPCPFCRSNMIAQSTTKPVCTYPKSYFKGI